MAMMFPTLGKMMVQIQLDDKGSWIEVRRLGVSDWDKFKDITASLVSLPESNEEKIKLVNDAIAKLQEMACRVMPEELHDKIKVLNYQQISALVHELCTAEESTKGESLSPEKKITYPSQQNQQTL